MNDRTFTVTMTEDERLMNLAALGFASVRLPQGEPATVINDLIAKLTKITATPTSETVAQFTFHDYFARDRNGNIPSDPPQGAGLMTVKIVGAQETASKTPDKSSFLKVVFTGGHAVCFDSALWPHIVKQTGQDAILYVAKSGDFLNIVGVRA
jgi:hypothetical protein